MITRDEAFALLKTKTRRKKNVSRSSSHPLIVAEDARMIAPDIRGSSEEEYK